MPSQEESSPEQPIKETAEKAELAKCIRTKRSRGSSIKIMGGKEAYEQILDIFNSPAFQKKKLIKERPSKTRDDGRAVTEVIEGDDRG